MTVPDYISSRAPADQLLQSLAAASDKLSADFGTWKTPWGDINRFQRLTDDIVQSDRMGISIAESLRNLARDARIMRRQAAEELARKAPIKMVPVLIFCVLPALGIFTTAPAAILLMRTFSQSTQLP